MSDCWDDRNRGGEHGTLVLGVLLIVLGCLFLAGEQFNINWDRYGWPVFVIVPGLVLLVLGLAIPGEAGLGLAIPGGIVTTVGLILALQNSTDTYASWAYAWALVAPGSVGVSLFLYGLLHRRLDLVDAGLRTGAVALGNTGSTTAMRQAMPFLAVALGAVIVLINIMPRPRSGNDRPESSDTWHDGGSVPPAPLGPAGSSF
jgi:hypothetical protein